MTLGRVGQLVAVAMGVLIANIASSILYMVVYGHLIDPGHEEKYYQDHIQNAAPYCSIIAGIPLMFLAGWWVSGWWQGAMGWRAGLVVWLAYGLIDIAILLAVGLTGRVALLWGVSFFTKLLAVLAGSNFRAKRAV